MKTYLKLSVLTVLLMAASSPCFAMMEIADVSKARAKELGMEIRAQASGPNDVWVELEVKTESDLSERLIETAGWLKNFSRVDLEIREGEKLLVGYAALKEDRSKPGRVVVSFMANRASLDKITLRVVTGVPMDMAGYDLRVKDFIEPVPAAPSGDGAKTNAAPLAPSTSPAPPASEKGMLKK